MCTLHTMLHTNGEVVPLFCEGKYPELEGVFTDFNFVKSIDPVQVDIRCVLPISEKYAHSCFAQIHKELCGEPGCLKTPCYSNSVSALHKTAKITIERIWFRLYEFESAILAGGLLHRGYDSLDVLSGHRELFIHDDPEAMHAYAQASGAFSKRYTTLGLQAIRRTRLDSCPRTRTPLQSVTGQIALFDTSVAESPTYN
jgi:hypothetical protein